MSRIESIQVFSECISPHVLFTRRSTARIQRDRLTSHPESRQNKPRSCKRPLGKPSRTIGLDACELASVPPAQFRIHRTVSSHLASARKPLEQTILQVAM